MKTDSIAVDNQGTGLAEVLKSTEQLGCCLALSPKDQLHLRLLAEELMSMVRSITGTFSAQYWAEAEDRRVTLHLSAKTKMDAIKRYQLISASSSGKNEAAHSFIGLLVNAFEVALRTEADGIGFDFHGSPMESLPHERQWDGFDQSILKRLADEIKIGVLAGSVNMTITKQF